MGEPLRVIVCGPPAHCTCPAVAWYCRKDCKGYLAWVAQQQSEQERQANG